MRNRYKMHWYLKSQGGLHLCGILLFSVSFLPDTMVIYCKAVVIHCCKATAYVFFLLELNPVAGELELTAFSLYLSLKESCSYSCLRDHSSTSLLQRFILSVLNTCVQRDNSLFIPCNIFFCFVTFIFKFSCWYFNTLKYFNLF